MDYFIITVVTLAGLVFHAWLFVRFRRWADRDLALSLAGDDPNKREWALQRLAAAKTAHVKRRDLQTWLERELERYNASNVAVSGRPSP
ncbi:hypothetical protein CH92_06300 [Stutzerimonas stutzeri]|uniref:30S ribosomal protein S3 n=1 Tax=Stutzerimonas stutzeri TaxID=316 RepID=W8RRR8_STUST|nr:hypothetical protein [Stutzerimonas stutzeri]AHL74731.1 hypothetical protein CH92_06300 [Stutzerimonas stutzeri]MCQ4329261.1 hypothetical protein [Stutzerimonas stutzeri]